MKNSQFRDEELNLSHGEWVYSSCKYCIPFQFRYGPAGTFSIYYRNNKTRNNQAWAGMRYPKTLNILKWAFAHEDEGIKTRPKANHPKYVPTAWEDLWTHNEKCWKRHRKTQYKTK